MWGIYSEYMFFFGGDTSSKSKYGGAQHRLLFVATDRDQLILVAVSFGTQNHMISVDFSLLTSRYGLGMTHPPVELGSISKP
jgi:hypothetical protein